MGRTAGERADIGNLDELAAIHHRDAVSDLAHQVQVVSNEEVCGAETLTQRQKQLDDLGWIETSRTT